MKKITIFLTILFVVLLAGCNTTSDIKCGEGTIAVGNTCVVDDGTHNEDPVCVLPEVLIDGSCSEPADEEPVCVLPEVLIDGSCSEPVEELTCTLPEVLDGDECKVPLVVESNIDLVASAVIDFQIGDTLPDFTTYFTKEGVTITPEMISHTLLLDTNNIMITAGVYSVTITIGNETKTVNLSVSDDSVDFSDVITEGVAGIYINPAAQTTFELGAYMPNFMEYFIAYDGTNYVTFTPDKILHNLLLAADNRMIQAGTYQVTLETMINGTTFTKTVDLIVNTIGGSTAASIGNTGWEMVNGDFSAANVFDAWFVPNGDVTITSDSTEGIVDVHVNTVGMNFWDVLFAQPGKVFEKGYTYEITYRLKTGLSEGRDVVLFVEPAQGAAKLLEEQVSLTTEFQDFTFTFQTLSTTDTGMVGVFIGANLPGAHPGSIIFDSIVITRTGELEADVYLQEIPNQDFANSDISAWDTEGNVTLSHDANGYLVVNVSAFTGAFYQENIQLGGFSVTSGKTYTVTYVVKTDISAGRDITFFVEDTDAGYAKYFEETVTLTESFQTFTYTFTPTADNGDTKIGIFVGDMENAFTGNVIIDSITVTEE